VFLVHAIQSAVTLIGEHGEAELRPCPLLLSSVLSSGRMLPNANLAQKSPLHPAGLVRHVRLHCLGTALQSASGRRHAARAPVWFVSANRLQTHEEAGGARRVAPQRHGLTACGPGSSPAHPLRLDVAVIGGIKYWAAAGVLRATAARVIPSQVCTGAEMEAVHCAIPAAGHAVALSRPRALPEHVQVIFRILVIRTGWPGSAQFGNTTHSQKTQSPVVMRPVD